MCEEEETSAGHHCSHRGLRAKVGTDDTETLLNSKARQTEKHHVCIGNDGGGMVGDSGELTRETVPFVVNRLRRCAP